MKYTNIKKLLIKFMGGGLINFPTRFLRWIKIDGDAEGDDGGSGGDSTEIDYEAIYQFYKNQIISYLPEEEIENYIIQEHYADVEIGVGTSQEYMGKTGIWKIGGISGGSVPGQILFIDLNNFTNEPTIIYIGPYEQQVPGPS